MRAPTQSYLLITLLLSTAACTQPPAQVDLRGQNSYGRDGTTTVASNYAAYKPSAGGPGIASTSGVYDTGSKAPIQSIGVSDLTPPSGGTPASNRVQPVKMSANNSTPFAPASATRPLPSDTINPWTNAPRDNAQQDSAPRTSAAFDALDHSFYMKTKGQKMASKEQKEPQQAAAKTTGVITTASNEESHPIAKPAAVTQKVKKAEVASNGFMWPINSKKVISEFGPKGKGKVNDGINIASAAGEPVWAAADGEVLYVGNELQGYGNIVIIKHSGDKTTTYAHLNRYTVDKYDRVHQGDIIGYVGNTGNVKDPQLHFAIRDGKEAVDPMKYLKRDVASLR